MGLYNLTARPKVPVPYDLCPVLHLFRVLSMLKRLPARCLQQAFVGSTTEPLGGG